MVAAFPEIASLGTTEQAEEFDHAVPCFAHRVTM
jgi:hypothetical protein